MGGGERYNVLKTKDQNSQKMVHKKKEKGRGWNSSAVMQTGGKNKNFPHNQNWNSSLSGPSSLFFFFERGLLFKSQANQNYTGAKFIELPSPRVLPTLSSHWVPVSFIPSDKKIRIFQIKTLLKVQV
uniref:Uncharacterized protein n=1 Tax=Nomascus leucogenys TaxID=61853 RepID=A0A2I3GU58_NOMLE